MNNKNQKYSTKCFRLSNVKCQRSNVQKGSILLEAFVAVMIIGITFAVILDIATLSLKTSTSIKNASQANFLLKESMETIRSFRDGTTWATNGLGTVNTGDSNPYYFSLDIVPSPDRWVLTPGTETAGIFTRKIYFDQVYRDSSSNIVTTGGTLDDDTKKATVVVTWPERSMQLITYFTNWK